MTTDLKEQIEIYGAQLIENQAPLDSPELLALVERVREIPASPVPTSVGVQPRSVWVAAIAAVVVLVTVGGLALLSVSADPPADEPVTTVPRETTVTTQATVPPETSVPPTTVTTTAVATTEVPEAVPPPGEGPRLVFVQTDTLPFGFGDGVWFEEALYATSLDDDELFRSFDGFTWEPVPGFPDATNLSRHGPGLIAGTDVMFYAGLDGTEAIAPEGKNASCVAPGEALVVHVSSNGADWETSRIDLPIPGESNGVTCHDADLGARAVGSRGILISVNFDGVALPDLTPASIFQEEFGLYLVTEGGYDMLRPEPDDPAKKVTLESDSYADGILEWTTTDGDVYTVDLEAAGYLDRITDIGAFLRTSPTAIDLQSTAWFSPDGQTWTELDSNGPLEGRARIVDIVATPDGFVATEEDSSIVWETADGRTWTKIAALFPFDARLDMWNGRLVAVARDEVRTIEDERRQLIPFEAATGLSKIQIGGLGLIAVPEEWDDSVSEVLFSADGTTWNRWTPPEFPAAENTSITIVGITDDRVVLTVSQWADGDQDTVRTTWVGTLP